MPFKLLHSKIRLESKHRWGIFHHLKQGFLSLLPVSISLSLPLPSLSFLPRDLQRGCPIAGRTLCPGRCRSTRGAGELLGGGQGEPLSSAAETGNFWDISCALLRGYSLFVLLWLPLPGALASSPISAGIPGGPSVGTRGG